MGLEGTTRITFGALVLSVIVIDVRSLETCTSLLKLLCPCDAFADALQHNAPTEILAELCCWNWFAKALIVWLEPVRVTLGLSTTSTCEVRTFRNPPSPVIDLPASAELGEIWFAKPLIMAELYQGPWVILNNWAAWAL